jgi:Helicase conserved C-terminal domain
MCDTAAVGSAHVGTPSNASMSLLHGFRSHWSSLLQPTVQQARAQVLHAQQQQKQRLKALDRFKADSRGVLVATDVAARGLDIPNVRCVIQCQLPPSADTYIHRAGRTARGVDGHGVNIAIVVPNEVGRFSALGQLLQEAAPTRVPVHPAVLEHVQHQVKLAEHIDNVERQQRKSRADVDWFSRSASELGALCLLATCTVRRAQRLTCCCDAHTCSFQPLSPGYRIQGPTLFLQRMTWCLTYSQLHGSMCVDGKNGTR